MEFQTKIPNKWLNFIHKRKKESAKMDLLLKLINVFKKVNKKSLEN